MPLHSPAVTQTGLPSAPPELQFPLELSVDNHHACTTGMCLKHSGQLWSLVGVQREHPSPKCAATCDIL